MFYSVRFPVLKNDISKMPENDLQFEYLSQLAAYKQAQARVSADPWSAIAVQQQELAAQRLIMQQQVNNEFNYCFFSNTSDLIGIIMFFSSFYLVRCRTRIPIPFVLIAFIPFYALPSFSLLPKFSFFFNFIYLIYLLYFYCTSLFHPFSSNSVSLYSIGMSIPVSSFPFYFSYYWLLFFVFPAIFFLYISFQFCVTVFIVL